MLALKRVYSLKQIVCVCWARGAGGAGSSAGDSFSLTFMCELTSVVRKAEHRMCVCWAGGAGGAGGSARSAPHLALTPATINCVKRGRKHQVVLSARAF